MTSLWRHSKKKACLPYASLSAFELVQYIFIVFQEVFVDDVNQLWVCDVKWSSCQGDDGCDGGMVDAALEDGGAYCARGTCNDDFHVVDLFKEMVFCRRF